MVARRYAPLATFVLVVFVCHFELDPARWTSFERWKVFRLAVEGGVPSSCAAHDHRLLSRFEPSARWTSFEGISDFVAGLPPGLCRLDNSRLTQGSTL